MKSYPILVLLLTMGLAGCMHTMQSDLTVGASQVSANVTSSANLPELGLPPGEQVLQAQYDVREVNIVVPETLRVSEANTFHPNADIVWRGDPLGDRRAQVKAIFETAFTAATATMTTGPKVAVDIEVTYFHCLTEKTRYTVGGVHSMRFQLTVRDLETGAILQGPRPINADVKGAGGQRAIAEEEAGRTQKVVVTERLAEVIRRELSAPATAIPADALVTRYDGSPVALGATMTE